jgi:cytochrome P450
MAFLFSARCNVPNSKWTQSNTRLKLMTRDKYFDPLDPKVIADPFPAYRQLRLIDPVYWHEQLNSWVLTRYKDGVAVLSNSEVFASDFRRVGIPTPPPLLSLQTLDPPEQDPLRQFAREAVQSQNLKALELDAICRADALFDALAARERFDFASEFADPFTLGTICKLVGVPVPPRDEVWAKLNDDLDRSMDNELAPESEEAGLEARAAFSALVNSWLDTCPREGLLAYIAEHLEEAGAPREVVVNSLRAFWHAGFEVPSRFLANVITTLVQDKEAQHSLRQSGNFSTAMEELVRYCGPVHALSRVCTTDYTIAGKRIRSGDMVITLIAAANRDPQQFESPEELQWDRAPNQHLGFGKGAHACLGANLARIEARVVIPRLLNRFPQLRAVGNVVMRPVATLRGPARLPVSFLACQETKIASTVRA